MACLCSCRLSYSSNYDMIDYSVILYISLTLLHAILNLLLKVIRLYIDCDVLYMLVGIKSSQEFVLTCLYI